MFWQEIWNRVMNTNPGLWEICLRLACAMLVGLVIGTEREYTHRPAGMRTHILVALGACVVSITGEIIFNHYNTLGAFPDPARLSAQVITGVGFLGAGTIVVTRRNQIKGGCLPGHRCRLWLLCHRYFRYGVHPYHTDAL